MWMVKPHGVLFCRQVIAQHKVKLISAVSHTCDGRNGVVRLAVGFRKDHRVGVAVLAPFRKDSARQLAELRLVRAVQAQNRHRISDHAAGNFFKAGNLKRKFRFRFFHRERVVAALEMLMRQNAAADDGEVCVAAEEVMRELLDKRKQLVERRPINDHRRMLRIHHNRVFVVVDIGRILKTPRLTVHCDRHDAQILPRRVRDRARIANILDAEQTLGIPGSLFQLCRRNVSGVFFGLREVDGDFEFTVLRVGNPVLVLRDAVAADVVAVLTQLIEVVGRRFR